MYYIGCSPLPKIDDDHHLTLSQFVNNSSDYLTNDTQLIFAPENYSLESEILIENIRSFSISIEQIFSSRASIICDSNARFEFKNVSTVTLRGLDLIGCIEVHFISVGHILIESLRFYELSVINGSILTMDECTATLDRLAFVSSTVNSQANSQDNDIAVNDYSSDSDCPTDVLRGAAVISSRRSVIVVTQSQFEGNNMGSGSIIEYHDSNIVIFNTTFTNNSVATYCYYNIRFCCFTGGIVRSSGVQRSILKLYHTRFIRNIGVMICTVGDEILLASCEFVSNSAPPSIIMDLVYAIYTNMTISHTEFFGNSAAYSLVYIESKIANIEHSRFTNNIGYSVAGVVNTIKFTHNEFVQNINTSSLISLRGDVMILSHCKFLNNIADLLIAFHGEWMITILSYSEFVHNTADSLIDGSGDIITLSHSEFVNNIVGSLINSSGNITTLSHSEFINNTAGLLIYNSGGMITISYTKFVNNTAADFLVDLYGDMIAVSYTKFINNTADLLVILYGDIVTVSYTKFIENTASHSGSYIPGIVYIRYYLTGDKLNIISNDFIDNSAGYAVFIKSACKEGLSLSLGSKRCIKCRLTWQNNVTILVIISVAAGIAIVIFMLALNMTVAVGTLNGILFYAHLVIANADTYFFPFHSPNLVTVIISWLNLHIGFDICVYEGMDPIVKALIQLVFPFYIICLIIIVIVASECSSKFAKIIGKGNPVAVLATMILLCYAQLLNIIFGSIYLAYDWPAYGSHNIDVSSTLQIGAEELQQMNASFQATSYLLIVILILILILVTLFTAVVAFWQCLLMCQDKVVCKWVKYQKLRHFIEPYHAPYTDKHRYWTGLLLFIRVLLSFVSSINFIFNDPQIPVELMSTVVVIGALLLLKSVIATRVYKNWPLDVIETTIYFNLLAFSTLTWYNVSSQASRNQIAVAYTSVMIIFILLLGIIVFHIFRYTRLYKFPFVQKAFKWISSKLLEKPIQEAPGDGYEELDGYQLERPDDQQPPAVTYSIVDIHQPDQNQEADNETAY